MATINEIKQQAEAVKNATQVGENTAMRVGGALAGRADIAKEQEDNIRKKADKETMDVELGKKFDKESVVQESGDADDKVMSQKAVSDKLNDLLSTINKESELGVTQHFVKDDFTTKVEVKETNLMISLNSFVLTSLL